MGYVYILTNKFMPDLVKIGYTDRTPEERAKELYKDKNSESGVPVPFDVFNSVSCEKPRELETLIHNELKAYRVKNHKDNDKIEREFFAYPADAAFQKLKEIHKSQPTHAACAGSQEAEISQPPMNMALQIPHIADDRAWRKWTSQFLTRFKRKANT